jgi:hypothetical protein
MFQHDLKIFPQGPEFTASLDSLSEVGWDVVSVMSGMAQTGDMVCVEGGRAQPQVVPAFIVLLRRPVLHTPSANGKHLVTP